MFMMLGKEVLRCEYTTHIHVIVNTKLTWFKQVSNRWN